MSSLHTVNKSPFDRPSLSSALGHARSGDAVLLIEDGVVGGRKGSASADAIASALGSCKVYALSSDLSARGMTADDLVPGIETVDYAGFVDLAAAHERTVAWL